MPLLVATGCSGASEVVSGRGLEVLGETGAVDLDALAVLGFGCIFFVRRLL